MNGAEYVPQNLDIQKSYDAATNLVNRTLSFVLRLEKGDMEGPTRSIFLNFEAYNTKGEKVSSMRLGDTRSNGISRHIFSAYYGTFCSFAIAKGDDCPELKHDAHLYPIGVNNDLSPSPLGRAPALLIFPDTYGELTQNSFQHPEDWDKYIHFDTPQRVYPDFRGYDFWVRRACGEGKN